MAILWEQPEMLVSNLIYQVINDGNRIEWSPIRSVVMQRESDLFITSMNTDRTLHDKL